MAKDATKLTDKELEKLQGILTEEREAQGAFIGMSEQCQTLKDAVGAAWAKLKEKRAAIEKMQATLTKKYGDVNINIATGEFVADESEE